MSLPTLAYPLQWQEIWYFASNKAISDHSQQSRNSSDSFCGSSETTLFPPLRTRQNSLPLTSMKLAVIKDWEEYSLKFIRVVRCDRMQAHAKRKKHNSFISFLFIYEDTCDTFKIQGMFTFSKQLSDCFLVKYFAICM